MLDQPSCYCSPKLEGVLISEGHRGLFARQPIKMHEVLVVWGGEIVTYQTLCQLPTKQQQLSIQVEDNLYLVTTKEGPGDWANHSCNPNAGLDGQITLRAMRDIAVGEQICFDYAMADSSNYDEFDCQCGGANCRGRVTGNDWQNPELWQRYVGYFSPYLQRRIDQLKVVSFPRNGTITRRRRRAYQFA